MPDKSLATNIKDHIAKYLGRQLYDFVAVVIPVIIVVGFEIVQIGVAKREGRSHIQMVPNFPLDYRCPRKLRRWIHRDISTAPLYHATNADLDQAVYPLPMNELFRAILKGRYHRVDLGVGMKQDHRHDRQKDILLDRVNQLDFLEEVPLPSDKYRG